MQDRKTIIKNYDIRNGIIKSPGKFEGEAIYAPYFWNLILNGAADEDNGIETTIYVLKEDLELFPELEGITKVTLFCDSFGFVYCLSE